MNNQGFGYKSNNRTKMPMIIEQTKSQQKKNRKAVIVVKRPNQDLELSMYNKNFLDIHRSPPVDHENSTLTEKPADPIAATSANILKPIPRGEHHTLNEPSQNLDASDYQSQMIDIVKHTDGPSQIEKEKNIFEKSQSSRSLSKEKPFEEARKQHQIGNGIMIHQRHSRR